MLLIRGGIAKTDYAIEKVFRPELTLMPVFLEWTVAKQRLVNPCDFEDLEAWLTEKRLDAADVV